MGGMPWHVGSAVRNRGGGGMGRLAALKGPVITAGTLLQEACFIACTCALGAAAAPGTQRRRLAWLAWAPGSAHHAPAGLPFTSSHSYFINPLLPTHYTAVSARRHRLLQVQRGHWFAPRQGHAAPAAQQPLPGLLQGAPAGACRQKESLDGAAELGQTWGADSAVK